MDIRDVPSWILSLDQGGCGIHQKFVMNSGSLKEIAKVYEVSYPTVRIKLDRLIEKIKLNDAAENEEFIQFIKKLSIDDRINLEEAKLIIEKYKKEKER